LRLALTGLFWSPEIPGKRSRTTKEVTTTMIKIDRETRVTLNFSLKLEDGQVVDSNFNSEPVAFEVGDGKLLPGFESRLLGMEAGEEASFTIPADDAFGNHNEDNIQVFDIEQFADADELEKGLVLSFTDAAHGEVPGVIQNIDENQVWVDFNHPLAGRALVFDVKIHNVEPRTSH